MVNPHHMAANPHSSTAHLEIVPHMQPRYAQLMNHNTNATESAVPRDYLLNSLIQIQRETLDACVRHMQSATVMRDLVYTGFTALKLCRIELPHCPRLSGADFHVLYTNRSKRHARRKTRYLHLPESLTLQQLTLSHDGQTITCTHPLTTWAILSAFLSQIETTTLLDAILRASAARYSFTGGRILTIADAAQFLDGTGDFPGKRKCQEALSLIDKPTDSVMECRTLLSLMRHGLARPIVHWQIYLEELRMTVTVDTAYPEQKVIIEYDGDAHRRDKRQYRWDERKRQALRAAGYTVIVVFADDILTDDGPAKLAERVGRALGTTVSGIPLPRYKSLLGDDRRRKARDRQRAYRRRQRAMGRKV